MQQNITAYNRPEQTRPPKEAEYVDVITIAQHFGVSKRTITAWRKRLGMPCRRMSRGRRGGLVLFNVKEVEQWAEQFKSGGKEWMLWR